MPGEQGPESTTPHHQHHWVAMLGGECTAIALNWIESASDTFDEDPLSVTSAHSDECGGTGGAGVGASMFLVAVRRQIKVS